MCQLQPDFGVVLAMESAIGVADVVKHPHRHHPQAEEASLL
jgi:hypothetical protein